MELNSNIVRYNYMRSILFFTLPAIGFEISVGCGAWDDEWGRMQYARTAELPTERDGGTAHMRWGRYQDDGVDAGVLLKNCLNCDFFD
jgi:hypothetical protein